MALSSGSKLGPYEILSPLGAGAMGEVYRARDTRLARDVAIKVLPADLASNPERLSRFNQEGRSASALNHPNIVSVYENPGMTSDGRWIIIYNSYNSKPEIRGIWKIHSDGSGAVRIAAGLTQWPEVSPDGRYASYSFYKQSLNDRVTYERVVEIQSGASVPFEIEVSNRDRVGGRMRWMPDGKSIVFVSEDADGNWGLFVQDFIPGKDTRSSRRSLAGFDPDRKMDSFSISPDRSRIVMAEVEVLSSLIMAERIPGIE